MVVEDFGKGIPPEITETLFKGNYISSLGTKGEKGTGLGLSICNVFAELNRGKIWVESEQGKASRFFFTLPAKKR